MVLPGFFDTHVRLTTAIEKNTKAVIADTGSYATRETARRLRETLDGGVTTVRDLGGLDHGMIKVCTTGGVSNRRTSRTISGCPNTKLL
jgi:imidazolonepropionase-like amidohydrolase